MAAAVTGVAEWIREESSEFGEQWVYGISVFDDLTWTQRLFTLDLVATHLLTDTESFLELTAVNEATVGILFEHVRAEVGIECDSPDESGSSWRDLVMQAYLQTAEPEDVAIDQAAGANQYAPRSPHDVNRGRWDNIIEGLADHILWDRDYEMAGSFLDLAPDHAESMKAHLGIESDYYSSPGIDASSSQEVAGVFDQLLVKLLATNARSTGDSPSDNRR